MRRESLPFAVREGLRHGLQVLIELIHVGHAGDGGADARVTDHPLESGQQGPGLLERLVRLLPFFDAAEAAGHDLHGYDAHARLAGGVDGLGDGGVQAEVVRAENDVDLARRHQRRNQRRLSRVSADAHEAYLARFLGGLLRFE